MLSVCGKVRGLAPRLSGAVHALADVALYGCRHWNKTAPGRRGRCETTSQLGGRSLDAIVLRMTRVVEEGVPHDISRRSDGEFAAGLDCSGGSAES
jgi:hypothetical protein